MRKLLGVVLGLGALGGTAAAQGRVSPDHNEMYDYVLTMDKIHNIDATKRALEKARPEVARAAGGSIRTVDDMIARMQSSPKVMSALRANGLSPRDYAVGMLALFRAMTVAAGKKAGGGAGQAYASLGKDVSPANEAFVEQYFDEVRVMFSDGSRR